MIIALRTGYLSQSSQFVYISRRVHRDRRDIFLSAERTERKKLKGSAPVKYDIAFNGVKVQGLGKAVEIAPPSELQQGMLFK